MSDDKETNKDIANFHHLCKDLYKYIQRRIIKKYIYPDMEYAKITSKNSVNNILEGKKEKEWKYYKAEENISEEEKILDIFKDNDFLSKIQKCYESLDVIIKALDENQKNVQFLKKNIDLGEQKIEMLSKLNTQLNQFFNKNNESKEKIQNIKKDLNDNKNVIDKLNLVKSLNILNDLQLMNSINDVNKKDNINNSNTTNTTNTTITNNNNIILDNKIINNNIRAQENKEKIDIISNEDMLQNNFGTKYDKNANNNFSPNSFNFLNKKSKREKNDINHDNSQIYNNNHYECNLGTNSFLSKNKKNKNKKKNNKNNKNQKLILPNNKLINNTDSNNFQSTNNLNQNESLPISINSNKIELKENENEIKEESENINKEEENKSNNENNENTLEIEFDKVLKKEFSSIYSFPQNDNSKKEIIRELKIILKKIPNMKFNKQNKFDDPCLIGSFSNFNLIYLLDYFPAIDILFKCKCIEGIDELKNIAAETMKKKLCFKYIQISDNYDKKNEIVKLSNKCKLKLKYSGEFFIYINLFFVGVNLSNYNKKEQSINRFFFNNNMTENKGKIIICLFFRRWRRKFKLFFIMPELIDIIIYFYFNENESLALIIEKIFYDLFNGQINFDSTKNNNIYKEEENIKEINEFISEWLCNEEYKNALNNAIISTQELIMKNDFYSTFNNE